MSRPLTLLIAAVGIACAPAAALAQAWPSTVVAAAPQMTSQARAPALNLDRDITLRRPTDRLQTAAAHRSLRLKTDLEPDDIPKVELRAKADWSDDEGLRVGPTRVTYRSRF